MIKLIRSKPITKPIGTVSEMFHSRQQNIKVGDHCEIVGPDNETLNIAKVTEITERDGVEVMRIVMVA